MDSTDCFLEILSAYQSSDSGCQVSLLEYCHRFGVDYYKFLGWYRHYKCQLTNPTSPSGMQLTPIHVNGSPSGHSRCTLSPKSVKSDNSSASKPGNIMLGLNPSMRFYLCEGPVDMRKGIFTLAELVRKIMGKEPSTGDIFIFLSKDRRNIKILHHDTGGYVLYWKKLDKDRFLLPVFCKASHRYEIGWEKLVVLLQGTVRKELLVG